MRNRFALFLGAALLAAVIVGCTKDEEPVTKKNSEPMTKLTPSSVDAETMAKAHSESEGATSKDLKELQKEQLAAKASFEMNASNKKAKEAFVSATVKLGTATMMSPDLSPREKYSGALKLYREALKLDPKNEEALTNKKMIEDIYKQMGRPIPQ